MSNILVFPCGSEIGLEIHNALKFAKGINLYGGSSVSDHGMYVYKNYIDNFPNVDNDNFITHIEDVVQHYKIDYIFPAHDSVVLKLAQNQDKVSAEILTSPLETCEIARSKKKTYQFFKNETFTPRIYNKPEEVKEFPVFLKPDVGQGSKGVALAKNIQELEYLLNKNRNLITVEYLPGKEYTIDCFTDRNRKLRFAGMRERRRIKSGISVNSTSIKLNEEIRNIAQTLNDKLNFRGIWFFQVKEDTKGNFKLLEIATRVAGTMSLYRNKGINFPLLAIFDRKGYDIGIIENDFNIEVERALTNRFSLDISYKRVFVDFDDTVTLQNKVNPYVIMFLYQCLNKDIDLYLITKHINKINETLRKLKINADMFKEIIHINADDDKYKYIKSDESAIFIDDSYKERKDIIEKIGIPVFDLDAIECLIDWRI